MGLGLLLLLVLGPPARGSIDRRDVAWFTCILIACWCFWMRSTSHVDGAVRALLMLLASGLPLTFFLMGEARTYRGDSDPGTPMLSRVAASSAASFLALFMASVTLGFRTPPHAQDVVPDRSAPSGDPTVDGWRQGLFGFVTGGLLFASIALLLLCTPMALRGRLGWHEEILWMGTGPRGSTAAS